MTPRNQCAQLHEVNTKLWLVDAKRRRHKQAWGVQTDLPPSVSAQCMQTNAVGVEGIASQSYASVAGQSNPFSVCDKGLVEGPVLPLGRSGPSLVGSRAVVVHRISCSRSLVEVLW